MEAVAVRARVAREEVAETVRVMAAAAEEAVEEVASEAVAAMAEAATPLVAEVAKAKAVKAVARVMVVVSDARQLVHSQLEAVAVRDGRVARRG